MIKRYLMTGAFFLGLGLASLAQVDKKIDEHAKDSNRQKNAAKADVWISQQKHVIADTSTITKAKKKTSACCEPKSRKKVNKKAG